MIFLKKIQCVTYFGLTTILLTSLSWAADKFPPPETYLFSAAEARKISPLVDAADDVMVTAPLSKILPSQIWEYMIVDMEGAKRLNAELVGFKSPDVVGKIAPEIKPGKYTYKDLEQHPGLKGLLAPEFRIQIRAAGPPLACAIEDFEIIPTVQLYWFMRYAEATKRNLGKTKLDKEGYMIRRSWEGGCPFPRPSGKFKAQQLYYNFEKRAGIFEYCTSGRGGSQSIDKNLKTDKINRFESNFIKLMGRTLFPSYGWFDKRAERNGETWAQGTVVYEPRANRGTALLRYFYDDVNKMDSFMIYVPSLRRIRKMSATDSQDPLGDMTYDDSNHCQQKISPKRFPYKFDIIEDREYLFPVAVNSGKVWIDSKNGYALREVKLMRRPCYVLQMTQLDPNYLYGKRIIYIDKENYMCQFSANYDQKGRLYRTQLYAMVWMPEIGQCVAFGTPTMQFDHVDEHSTFQVMPTVPVPFSRQEFSMQELIKRGK